MPFYIVAGSFCWAWFLEVTFSHQFGQLYDVGIIFLISIIVLNKKTQLSKFFFYIMALLFAVFFSVGIYTYFITGSFFSGSGLLGITVITFVFIVMLESNKSNNQVFYLINQIAILYTIHVVYILFETIILETSGTNVFIKTFIQTHRILVGQPIRSLLDIGGSGSNGIMVGAQVASQMLVLSMIFFIPIFKFKQTNKYLSNGWMFLLSLILWPFCMTGTSVLMFLLTVFIIALIVPKYMLNKQGVMMKKLFTVLILILGISGYLWDMLLYRIKDQETLNIYLYRFLDPLVLFLKIPLEKQLFGANYITYIHQQYAGDFAFAVLVVVSGLVLSIFVCIIFIAIILRTIYMVRKCRNIVSPHLLPWLTLAFSSALGMSGWWISLAHYGVALESGGRHFFALTVAVTVVCLFRIKPIISSSTVFYRQI